MGWLDEHVDTIYPGMRAFAMGLGRGRRHTVRTIRLLVTLAVGIMREHLAKPIVNRRSVERS